MAARMSHEEVRQMVRTAIVSMMPAGSSLWIVDMYDDECVYGVDQPDGSTRYWSVSYEIVDGSVVIGEPTEVSRRSEWAPVTYEAVFEKILVESSGDVVATVKVFELGDWPDKKFSLSAEEASEAAAEVEANPAPVRLSHQRTVLDAHDPWNIGELFKMWREGKALYGLIRFRRWVADALSGQAPKVSLGWSRHPKRVVECSLVLDPRIDGAGLLAAFDAHRSGSGMEWFKRLKAAVAGVPDELPAPSGVSFGASDPTEGGLTAEDVARIVDERLKAFSGRSAATPEQLSGAVESFRSYLQGSGRVVPASVGPMTEAYRQALIDDGGGAAVFEHGRPVEGARARSLRSMVDSLPPLVWTSEDVPAGASFHVEPGFKADDDGVVPVSVDVRAALGVKA
ncbi:MAG: hypothetical protein KF884_10705 [Fimbriimonadaceae bacterium]|nr:hypothetical protein [Fimbriimonadaceae bacterium]QYK58016.1 MAG: hypothetical protein KF884_10705 [Fimbriimonadaceae bacterium]